MLTEKQLEWCGSVSGRGEKYNPLISEISAYSFLMSLKRPPEVHLKEGVFEIICNGETGRGASLREALENFIYNIMPNCPYEYDYIDQLLVDAYAPGVYSCWQEKFDAALSASEAEAKAFLFSCGVNNA